MKLTKHALFIALTLAACSSSGGNSQGTGGVGNAGSSGSSGAPSSVAGAGAGAGVGGSPTNAVGGSGGVGGGNLGGGAGVNSTAGGAGVSGVSGSGGHAGASTSGGQGGGSAGAPYIPDGGGGVAGSAGSGGGSAHGGASGGCGKPVVRPSLTAQQQMSVSGTQRTYLLEVPQGVDNQTPLALIFALHGANMTNTQVVGSFNLGTLSKGQAITVYPQGDETASGARWTSNEANWSYLQMLMTDLESRYCVDPNRAFLTGFSMGGGFTMDTACQKSSMFRAFATVEGYGPGGVSAATQPTCANAAAKAPLLIIQGSTDGTVTPAMGQASLAFWTGKNGCSATTSMPMGMGFTSCTANADCTSGFPVYYCTGTWMHAITSTAAADVWAFFSTFK